MVSVKKCSCEHKFQDKEYGFSNRVMNELKKSGTTLKFRCTVCSKVHG